MQRARRILSICHPKSEVHSLPNFVQTLALDSNRKVKEKVACCLLQSKKGRRGKWLAAPKLFYCIDILRGSDRTGAQARKGASSSSSYLLTPSFPPPPQCRKIDLHEGGEEGGGREERKPTTTHRFMAKATRHAAGRGKSGRRTIHSLLIPPRQSLVWYSGEVVSLSLSRSLPPFLLPLCGLVPKERETEEPTTSQVSFREMHPWKKKRRRRRRRRREGKKKRKKRSLSLEDSEQEKL